MTEQPSPPIDAMAERPSSPNNGSIPDVTAPTTKLKSVTNPYTLKKTKEGTKNRYTDIGTLIEVVSEYINILVGHDESLHEQG